MDPTQEAAQTQKESTTNRVWVYDSLNNWVCLEDPVVEPKPEALKEDIAAPEKVELNASESQAEPVEPSSVKDAAEGEKKEEVVSPSEEQKDVYTLIQKFDIVQKKKLYQHDTLGLTYVQSLKDREAEVLTA